MGESKQVCLPESTSQSVVGDKGSGLKKGPNSWVSLKPIFNFTLILNVKGSKRRKTDVIGSKHITGIQLALEGRVAKRQKSLTMVLSLVPSLFREPPLCSVPLSGADRQGEACWLIGTDRGELYD